MTLKFNNSYIKDSYSFLGRNEYGIKLKVDKKINDFYLNAKSVEEGEIEMFTSSIKGLLKKTKLEKISLKEIDINRSYHVRREENNIQWNAGNRKSYTWKLPGSA